jgi:nucleoside-diphosphate kinase
MAVERTFVMVKPGGVERGLAGEIVRRFERRGYVLRGAKLMKVSAKLAKEHYAEHKARPFFGELVEGITRSPVLALVVEGESAVSVARTMIGATNPVDSAPGTIRGDLATEMGENVVHGSDSLKSAKREIALWFDKGELVR